MYVVNGIAYAGDKAPEIKVSGIKPLDGYGLWLRFNTGESKTFDFSGLLNEPAFSQLSDKKVFDGVYIDYGIPTWSDGAIDVSPKYLYDNSVPNE